MGIVLKKGPDNGQSEIGKALSDLRGRDAGPEALLGGAAISLSAPLPVYRLGLDEIEAQASLSRAEHVGWRYLIEGSGQGAAFADVNETEGDPRFASFSQNENADRLIAAANLAQEVAQGLPETYEARILDVPALYTSAIWLSGAEDIFIPYVDMRRLRGKAVQVEPTFLSNLVTRAQHAREQNREKPDPMANSL
jgi:hypothetical protein